jgi:hypothetical protein
MAGHAACLLRSCHDFEPSGKQLPKGDVVKLIAALLLCVAMTSHATNFSGMAAMNESGVTTTQTAGITGTDIAMFYFPVPETPGQTYVITIVPAPGTPTIERYAFISDGTFDLAHARGFVPQFVLTVGTGAGELAPGAVHELWVDSTDSNGNFSCNAAECDMTVRIELYQAGKMQAPLLPRHRAN